MPAYAVEFAAEAERDFELIFDFLKESYGSFGESTEDTIAHAARRVEAIRATAARLGNAPYHGTLRQEMMPDLRHGEFGETAVACDPVVYEAAGLLRKQTIIARQSA